MYDIIDCIKDWCWYSILYLSN